MVSPYLWNVLPFVNNYQQRSVKLILPMVIHVNNGKNVCTFCMMLKLICSDDFWYGAKCFTELSATLWWEPPLESVRATSRIRTSHLLSPYTCYFWAARPFCYFWADGCSVISGPMAGVYLLGLWPFSTLVGFKPFC